MIAHNVLITGASGGIGAALARVYAVPGSRLLLWGRNEERLAETAAQCRARGARRIVVPWRFAVIRAAAKLVPRPIMRAVLSRLVRATPD